MMHICRLLALLFLLISCATQRPEGVTEAEVLYRESEQFIKAERFLLATEKLHTIKTHHPYSVYAAQADFLLAEILFLQGNYAEAAANYLMFRDLHPRFERMEYVIYQIAQSYYKQLPSTHDRDLSSAHDAIRFFREIQALYPKGKYAIEAEERCNELKDLLQKKEFYVANFYYNTEVYDAAFYRYNTIYKNFPQSKEAILGALKSLYQDKKKEECLNFPTGEFSTSKEIQKIKKRCSTI